MGRSPCCDKMGLKKGPWTPDEDTKLLAHIQLHGHGNWHALPSKAGLRRCGKSCRLRWANYLRPDIKRGKFSLEEDETIIQLHALLGNRWSAIAAHLPKRTDNEIKNYWNTHLKKRLTMMGIDPVTHKPKNQALIGCGQLRDTPDVSHMAQWESARLEAEARSKLVPLINPYQNLLNTAAEAPPPPRRPPCLDVLKAWAWANPGKDVSTPNMLMNSFFSSSGVPSGLEYHDESITNPAGACTAGLPNSYQQQPDEAKGIMGNSMEIHDILNPNDPADSLGFQSFYMSHGFTNIATPSMASSNGPYYHINAAGSCWGVFEDNELNYSCNKLNVINQGKSSGNI